MAMCKKLRMYLNVAACLMLMAACHSELIETDAGVVTDTGDVTITCDAAEGNQGLHDYQAKCTCTLA
jgi:hypothetical protein